MPSVLRDLRDVHQEHQRVHALDGVVELAQGLLLPAEHVADALAEGNVLRLLVPTVATHSIEGGTIRAEHGLILSFTLGLRVRSALSALPSHAVLQYACFSRLQLRVRPAG